MVTARAAFEQAFRAMPLVAILRGVRPGDVTGVADALMSAGFTLIEVPLNSPDSFESIARLIAHCPDGVVVGAGTVLRPQDADRLGQMGAGLMVTPNTDPAVMAAGRAAGLVQITGCMTPSEALLAGAQGAAALKIFPASALSTGFAADIKAVLPRVMPLIAVGGVSEDHMVALHGGGYDGFGFGSCLYRPDRPVSQISQSAQKLVHAWSRLQGG